MERASQTGVHCSLFVFDFPFLISHFSFLIFHLTSDKGRSAKSEMRNEK